MTQTNHKSPSQTEDPSTVSRVSCRRGKRVSGFIHAHSASKASLVTKCSHRAVVLLLRPHNKLKLMIAARTLKWHSQAPLFEKTRFHNKERNSKTPQRTKNGDWYTGTQNDSVKKGATPESHENVQGSLLEQPISH